MLSLRGQANAHQMGIPWRFAKRTEYDPVTNPDGVVGFGTAENVLVQGELEEFARKVPIPGDAFRYAYCAGGGLHLPSAFAKHINELFNPHQPVEDTDVKITSAATALHDILAYSLCEPGDGILVSKPYYGRFELDFGNQAGVKLVAAETDHQTCFEEESVINAFEEKLKQSAREGVQIKAVLIVNPHNPLGRCYPDATLLAIMKFCNTHSLHLISDEIYALSTFANPDYPNAVQFTSILSINLADIINFDLVHATYGLSKDFGAAGLKVGALITRNEPLKKAVDAVVRFHGVSGPSIAVATAMLEDREWCQQFIATAKERVADAYAFTTSRLSDIGIQYFKGGNAGFFLWLDLSAYLPPKQADKTGEMMLAKKFLDEGVFLHPGEEHGRPGWFRLVFTMERAVVEEGLKRIAKVVENVDW